MGYRHIMAAVDLGPESEQVCARARELAQRYAARASLIHLVEPVIPAPPYELPGLMPVELEQQLVAYARTHLQKLAERHAISETDAHVEVGVVKHGITHWAEEHGVDLIVVGSHGRHGVGRLLGSTANAVLHHAHCDVLAVRVGR